MNSGWWWSLSKKEEGAGTCPHQSCVSPDIGEEPLLCSNKGVISVLGELWPQPWRFEKQYLADGRQPAVSKSWAGGGCKKNTLCEVLYLFWMSSSPFCHVQSHQRKSSIGDGQLGGSRVGALQMICLKWGTGWGVTALLLGEESQALLFVLLTFAPRNIAAVCLTPPSALPKPWRIPLNQKAWGELMWVKQLVQRRGCLVVRRLGSGSAHLILNRNFKNVSIVCTD